MSLTLADFLGIYRGFFASGYAAEGAEFPYAYLKFSIVGGNFITELYPELNTQPVVFHLIVPSRNTPFVITLPLSIMSVQDNILYVLEYPVAAFNQCNQLVFVSQVFERIPDFPASLRAYFAGSIDWTDATFLYNYIYSIFFKKNFGNIFGFIDGKPAINDSFKTCTDKADRMKELLLSGKGYYKEKEVATIYKTVFPNDYPLTTVVFEGSNPFNPANIVTISGLKGDWAVLNGSHTISMVSGDQVFPSNMTDNRSSAAYIFLLYNSSALPEYNQELHGIAIARAYQEPLTKKSDYRPLMGAIDDLVRAAGPYIHNSIAAWSLPTPGTTNNRNRRLANSFAEINAQFGSGTLTNISMGNYLGLHIAQYYNGVISTESWNINNKYAISFSTAHFIPLNYLQGNVLAGLWFRSAIPTLSVADINGLASSTNGFVDIPKLLGVKYLYEFKMSINPPALGSNPQPWTLWPVSASNVRNFNAGLIEPSLINNKRIGYFRLGTFSQPVPILPGLNLDFNSYIIQYQLYAAAGDYLKNTLQVENIIIDTRVNTGGLAIGTAAFASLFGSDREIVQLYLKQMGAECSTLQYGYDQIINSPLSQFANTVFSAYDLSQKPSWMKEMFGDVVLDNMDIYYMSSINAVSGGSLIIPLMLGECLDGNIGNNTRVYLVGDSNPYNTQNSSRATNAPLNIVGPNYIVQPNITSNNFAFRYSHEYDSRFWLKHQQVPTSHFLAQLSPYLVLPRDYSIIYQDTGYEANPCPYLLPGQPIPSNNATWKDSWLEAILRLILKKN